jgi:hypothetical protein
MSDYPRQFARAPKCGAMCRGPRAGRPCRTPAMANGRCRMHGGKGSGAPSGEKNGMFKHGKYTRRAREVSQFFRQMARDGETMVARVMNAHGLKPTKALRRRTHVKRALAEAKASKGEKTE